MDLRRPQPPDSPISLASNLDEVETQSADSNTPRAADTNTLSVPTITPPASGSTTPTATIDASKKARSFLSFPPISGFFRGRYPSSTQDSTVDTSDDSQEAQEPDVSSAMSETAESEQVSGDDEDRKTISGVPLDTEGVLVRGDRGLALNGEEEKLDLGNQDRVQLHPDPIIHR